MHVPAASPSNPSVRFDAVDGGEKDEHGKGKHPYADVRAPVQKGNPEDGQPRAKAVQPREQGDEKLKEDFLPGAQPEIFSPFHFEEIVQKSDEQIAQSDGQGDDRRAVRPVREEGKGEYGGQNKSESAHRGRTAFAFVFPDVREDVLPGFQLAEDGDEQEAEDEGDAERRKRGGEIRFCLHSRYPLQSPRRTSSITALSL